MSPCIYCTQDASLARGVAHVLPEGFSENDTVLPHGAVCDGCNGYLGRKLDQTFVKHPAVSLMAQFLGLPGKKGSSRDRLGAVERDEERGVIYLPVSEVRDSFDRVSDGFEVTVPTDPTFDFRRFRRSLHHIGLNAYALAVGTDQVRQTEFDAVRRYVRYPNHREAWPIIQFVDANRPYGREGKIRFDVLPPGLFVGIVLSPGLAFAVDLMNSGGLAAWAPRRFEDGGEYFAANENPAPSPKLKGPVRHRLAISIKDDSGAA